MKLSGAAEMATGRKVAALRPHHPGAHAPLSRLQRTGQTKEGRLDMPNKVIVMVSNLDDPSHGEINVLDGPEQAGHFVETLLESGVEQERVRVFGGDELQMHVQQRLVVSLISNARDWKEEAPRDEEEEDEARAPQARPQQDQVAAYKAVVDEVAQPFVRNGVRFSSQFRPALMPPIHAT
jgi:hypothetical protein